MLLAGDNPTDFYNFPTAMQLSRIHILHFVVDTINAERLKGISLDPQ